MDSREDKIRVKAYDLWERQGRTGDPQDHWLEAERGVRAEEDARTASQDRSEATVEDASPVEAIEALEAASDEKPKRRRSSKD